MRRVQYTCFVSAIGIVRACPPDLMQAPCTQHPSIHPSAPKTHSDLNTVIVEDEGSVHAGGFLGGERHLLSRRSVFNPKMPQVVGETRTGRPRPSTGHPGRRGDSGSSQPIQPIHPSKRSSTPGNQGGVASEPLPPRPRLRPWHRHTTAHIHLQNSCTHKPSTHAPKS